MKHTISVKTLKDLPGVPKGTILKQVESDSDSRKDDWLLPEFIDEDGGYIPCKYWLIFSGKWQIDEYPEFFKRIYCKCECCCCVDCKCRCECSCNN